VSFLQEVQQNCLISKLTSSASKPNCKNIKVYIKQQHSHMKLLRK
jgi:formylmethanofuran dehydrogenase subunit D